MLEGSHPAMGIATANFCPFATEDPIWLELAALDERCQDTGLTRAAYLRLCGTGGTSPRVLRRAPESMAELRRIYGALGKIGGNVNQIAYRFHQGNQPTSQELAAIREQIAKMADVVLSALGKKL